MGCACDALRREWRGPTDRHAVQHLRERGFFFNGEAWGCNADADVTPKDLRAILFLHEQWGHASALFEFPPRYIN